MGIEYPSYNMSSVNGDYMNSGSNYAVNISPIQLSSPNYTMSYYEIEDRNSNNYPPIGQLVPAEGDCFFILFIIIYFIISLYRRHKIAKK